MQNRFSPFSVQDKSHRWMLSDFERATHIHDFNQPLPASLGHLEKFLSPSRHESDSMTARGHERMEEASHGAEGLFRC
jgi:hypothetical protein